MNIELKEINGELELYVDENKSLADIKSLLNKIKKSDIRIIRTKRLSLDQSKLIWVLCKELGDLIGYTREEMREVLEDEFCIKREIEYFSISPAKKDCCSMEVATEFIQFIIEFAIEQGYNLIIHEGKGEKRVKKSIREVVPDIQRYVIACLRSKTCAICGTNNADLHHWDNVSSIGGYEHDNGLKTRFISLCREHHTLFHSIGEKEFEKLYHLQGIWLTPTLVNDLKKVYKGHFKAFKLEDYKVDKEIAD